MGLVATFKTCLLTSNQKVLHGYVHDTHVYSAHDADLLLKGSIRSTSFSKPTKQPCGFNLILLTCLAVASSFLFLVSSDFLFHSLPLSFSSLAWLCFNL